MKTILQILVILLVAAAVSGGVYALVENTSLISSAEAERPQMTNADGTSVQMMERPEGGDGDGASFSRGIGEVGMLLAKITGITIVILLIQKAFERLRKPKLNPAM
ncbi:MAG: hypothetical protein AMXMBFR75_14750 [Candidatus Hinthialibacteria bacterium]|nr:hypothetical protein [Betaproteobacteria bacterium PRO4]